MYLPPRFRRDDPVAIREVIRSVRLASLVTVDDGIPLVSHLPLLLLDDPAPHGTLIGHLARGNPQVRTLDGPVLATFVADDAYIHPGWYASKRDHGKVVPTWNYVAVHARGTARTITEPGELRALVERLTDRHEAGRDDRWRVGDAPESYVDGQLRGIAGFAITITGIEAKWKLSQGQTDADVAGVIAGLDSSGDARDGAAAARMRSVRG